MTSQVYQLQYIKMPFTAVDYVSAIWTTMQNKTLVFLYIGILF